MQQLPPELHYYLLTPKEELVSLCRSSPDYYQICSSSGFWRRRFREENIPLLLEGKTFREWLLIYETSLLALERTKKIAQPLLSAPIEIDVSISGYYDPSIFSLGKITPAEVEEAFILSGQARIERNITSFFEGESVMDSFFTEALALEGIEPRELEEEKVVQVRFRRSAEGKFYYSFGEKSIEVSLEELFFLLFKLTFFLFDEISLEGLI